ncbi:YhcN/YlaJ family sporulation lipoprotein [Aquibacillus salsiterrae]|uniref:YhcN/YlaJ family sporulation lipoprotein n=1 Tax=Aquibacillus salsiterrae TaxID=2950439 RepID=A0A9X3WE58_9BACI|nr:YhcN/YlaJ family sporulation lipoprotein [Aquibacillus salsiterrae]MDC3416520.1 YhcN/YlaJ family sporulation lipoprotein [Aquibacillus salsiterrae]
MTKLSLGTILMISVFLIGCQQNSNLANQSEKRDQPIQVKNTAPMEREDYSNEEIAQHLSNIASKVPNVNGAYAVVAGPYAVVGVDLDKDFDRSRVGTVKFSVAEALQDDPYGKTAIVVADADGTERIRNMADKIKQGHPIEGVVDELAAIVGRYMPEMPVKENQSEVPDDNEELINEREENKLDEIQEDQSNQQMNK